MGNIESHPEDQRRKIYGGVSSHQQRVRQHTRPCAESRICSKVVPGGVHQQTAPTLFSIENRIEEYENEEQKLQRAYEKLREKRAAAFRQEMLEFEMRYNPYEVLGLSDMTTDVDAIKRAYKKQALRYHPDKGGDERKFAIVTKSFAYIMKKLEKLQYNAALPHEMKQSQESFVQSRPQTQNVLLDTKRLDMNKFNQVFEDHRLYDPTQDGYGDDMVHDSRTREPETLPQTQLFTGAFNKEIFDRTFEEQKRDNVTQEVVIYDEPEPLLSGKLAFYEMGTGKIDDFGRSDRVSGSNYSDYKKAHSTHSKLIDPLKVQYKTLRQHRRASTGSQQHIV